MSDYRKDLSRTLRQLRVSHGLSQQDVADVLHVNRSTYAYYETARITPDVATLKQIADLYFVSLDALFYPEESA